MIGVGIHDAIAPELYHSDQLTPEPSLSRSGIQTILTGTLADFAAKNPRLTQWPETMREATDATDLGEVVHAMVLGTGSKFSVRDPWDFTAPKTGKPYETWSGAAKEWRDAERARGMIVIGRDTNAMAMQISEKLKTALQVRFGSFGGWGARKVEQTVLAKRRLNDGSEIWCRIRIDALLKAAIVDVKTTALSLSDVELGRQIALKGLDIQSIFYKDTLKSATGIDLPFVFAWVQTVPPYAIRFVDLEGADWPHADGAW